MRYSDVDFNIHDEVVSQLLSVIECPMLKDISDDCIVFNNQCYDKKAWAPHVNQEQLRNWNGEVQGWRKSGDNQRLKDPRTGENFNIIHWRNKMLHRSLNRPKMKKLIMARDPSLQSKNGLSFVPAIKRVSVNDFVIKIQILGDTSVVK